MPRRQRVDRAMRYVLLLSALISIVIVFLIALFILRESLPAWRDVGVVRLLSGRVW